jgi:two-component system nitrogen regulation response regulator GlnG
VDVRVIAATHQNLEQRVRDGLFREDLYHRLNVIRIQLPSLNRRREDIPLLTRHFLAQAARELGGEPKILRPETESYLGGLDWPGNVRQLENLCRWLTVMASGREIHLEDLPSELRERNPATAGDGPDWETALRTWAGQSLARGEQNLLETALPSFERVLIRVALEQTGGHRQEAARLLGWGRNTLTRKIKELGME